MTRGILHSAIGFAQRLLGNRAVKRIRPITITALIVFALHIQFLPCFGQGTSFTYQGLLNDAGSPANGTNYGMVFYLYDAVTNGSLLGGLGITNIAVSNGLFTVPLNFGSVFNGNPRWLEIVVQKNGGGFTTLAPRQPIFPAPYAIFANSASNVSGTVSGSQISGAIPWTGLPPGVITNGANDVNISGTFTGNGASLTNVPLNLAYQSANLLFAGPANGPAAAPSFRPLGGVDLNSWTNIMFAGKGTNVTITAHNAGNLATNVPSLANITIGLDFADLINSRLIRQGASIGMPDQGAVVWANGAYIECQNNAHGESPYGSSFRIHDPNNIAILMDGGSPTPFFQFGYSGAVNELFLMQYNDATRSKLMQWRLQGGEGAAVSMQAVAADTSQTRFAELWFWSGAADQRAIGGGTSHLTGRMLTNGWDLRGRQIRERRTGFAGATCALDFNAGQVADLKATSTTITFYTTNRIGGATNSETRQFIIRGQGLMPTLTFPAAWTWLGSVPTSIANSNLIRLTLQSGGDGEPDTMASSESGIDRTYSTDPDANDYCIRANITNVFQKSALNNLARNAKAHGWWNCFTNGFFYVFVNGESNNLTSSSYTWVGHGTYSNDTNGFTSDGSSGFADSLFTASSAAALDATNMCLYAFAATNNSPVSGTIIIGSAATFYNNLVYATGANQVWATIGPNVATPASSASLVGNGSFDGNLMGIRTNPSTITVASTGNSAAASYVNTARDGAHIYIGARNDAIQAPTGYGHYKGTIKAAACGTGMSLSQANAMFADVNAFQAELGRPGISQ